jgi:putative hydrolase of the HAD superfamily
MTRETAGRQRWGETGSTPLAPPSDEALAAFIAASDVGDGSIAAGELFERLRDRFGSQASQAAFLDAWTCHFTLNDDVYRLLCALRAERPFVICSNTNAAHWDYLNRRYELDGLAAAAILSHEVGCEKPKAEIFRLAAAAHGCGPKDCLFVDDLAANVEAAQALGFLTHLFTGCEALRAALAV